MNADASADAPLTHDEAEELLPFYANGSLVGEELRRMQAHVHLCLSCRRELAEEQELAHAFREVDNATAAASDSLHRLLGRLDDPVVADVSAGRGHPTPPGLPRRLSPGFTAGITALAATVVLAVGSVALWPPGMDSWRSAEYATLAAREPAPVTRPGDLHVIFRPEVTTQEAVTLVRDLGLTFLRGPDRNGVYTIRPSGGMADSPAVLATLRTEPRVVFAEPSARAAAK